MKRNILTAIPFLALGGLLLTGCFDGSPLAGASDENKVQAENSDQNELATSAAIGDRTFRVSVKSTTRGYNFIKIVTWDKNNAFHASRCIDISRKNTWIDSRFTVNSEAEVWYHAWANDPCPVNKSPIRTVKLLAPRTVPLSTWFLNVL